MYRSKIESLVAWKNSTKRKPLILNGARQVGKTWLLREFGERYYDSVAYINLDNNETAKRLFELDFDIGRIVNGLELLSGIKIMPGNTLIVLDEIQECPKALASLKYFYETAPDYHVAVAGSLLGVAKHAGTSYPVGKVQTIDLHPLTFSEFVRASASSSLADALDRADLTSLEPFHAKLIDLLKHYLVIGGMPEVVQSYVDEGNVLAVRKIQKQILRDYEGDFSKHAPYNLTPRLLEIFNIIPAELAKENKKFIFKMIRTGARAAEYESALLWLEDAGVVRRVHRVSAAKMPLKAYAEREAFKLYLSDVGLLGAQADLAPEVILEGDRLFTEFKGAMAEQFALQELVATGYKPLYYKKDKPSREVDYILDLGHQLLPLEIKSGKGSSGKSLAEFVEENSISRAFKLTTQTLHIRRTSAIDYVPLYLCSKVKEISELAKREAG